MPKIDTDKLTPEEMKQLIEDLNRQQKTYYQENLLKTKEEFEKMARERGFTLGQLNLAGKKSRAGVKLGPRKKKGNPGNDGPTYS